jgi:hypothetical protein
VRSLDVVIASVTIWVTVGGAIAVMGGVLAFVNALIGNRTARLAWQTASGQAPTTATPRPQVVLPGRSHFVDRADVFDQAFERIGGGEIALAIEGGLGVGKSATATELAWRLQSVEYELDGLPDFSSHNFLRIDADDACPELEDICRPLSLLTGDQSLATVANRHKLDALRVHLARNRTVLLLDNLSLGESSACRSVRELIETVPAGSLVITSLNRPGVLRASRMVVKDLEPPYVRELVEHEARRLDLDNASELGEDLADRLYDILGGNPRMIGWFLQAYLRSTASLEDLLASVERGAGLSELFARVWEGVSQDARTALGACAYLGEQVIAQQVEIACELDRTDAARALEELVDVGLLVTIRATGQPTAYSCPTGVKRFALAETSKGVLALFTDRLSDYYITTFGMNWEDALAAAPHVSAIHTVMAELLEQRKDAPLQALLVVTLDLFLTLGLLDDRIRAGFIAYTSAVRVGNHRGASRASAVLASTYALRGELKQAREAVANGSLAAESAGRDDEIARQKRCDGFVHYRSAQPESALEAIAGAEELARSGDDLKNVVDILGLRAAAHWYRGALDESESAARSCLRVCEEIPWKRAKAYPLRDLAEIAIHRRQSDDAEAMLDLARAIALEFGDQRQLARIDLTEARLLLLGGRPRRAEQKAAIAEAASIQLGLPPEAREAHALRTAARRAAILPPLRIYYASRRPTRMTDAPVGGD